MKSTLVSKIKNFVMLGVFGLMALGSSAQAASFALQCKVAGYSSAGWIEIRPGSGTGGRVQYDRNRRVYYTDRVSRQEPLRVMITASRASEVCHNGGFAGAYADNGSQSFGNVRLPLTIVGKVTSDPRADNVHLWIRTSAGYFDTRIPLGRR